MRVNVAIAYRVVLALTGVSVGILQALITTKVVSWSPWVVVGVAGTFGGVTFLDNIRLIGHKFQAHERHRARSKMHQPLVGALNGISESREVPLRVLGVSVFAIRRTWSRRFVVLPWRKRGLRRLFRFRLSEHPAESAVDWTRGKGTIGECWDTGVPTLHDRRKVARDFGRDHHPSPEEFAALTPDQHCGFTREEFTQTIDKYGEILAVPIKKPYGGELIGVLSIDCLASAYDGPDSPSVLGGDDIEEIAGYAAWLIREYVPKF